MAGAAAGLAFASKYDGLAWLLVPGWVVAEITWNQRSAARLLSLGGAVLVGFSGALILACPPCVLSFDLVFNEMATIINRTGRGMWNNQLTPTLGWYGVPYLYQLVAGLPYVLGWPLYGLAAAGFARGLRSFSAPDRLILISIFPFFLVMRGSQTAFPRYLLPLVPRLMLFAGRFLFKAKLASGCIAAKPQEASAGKTSHRIANPASLARNDRQAFD